MHAQSLGLHTDDEAREDELGHLPLSAHFDSRVAVAAIHELNGAVYLLTQAVHESTEGWSR